MTFYSPAQIKKALFAAAGFAATVAATVLAIGPDLIPDVALPYIHIGLALATTYGVFQAQNTKVPDPEPFMD